MSPPADRPARSAKKPASRRPGASRRGRSCVPVSACLGLPADDARASAGRVRLTAAEPGFDVHAAGDRASAGRRLRRRGDARRPGSAARHAWSMGRNARRSARAESRRQRGHAAGSGPHAIRRAGIHHRDGGPGGLCPALPGLPDHRLRRRSGRARPGTGVPPARSAGRSGRRSVPAHSPSRPGDAAAIARRGSHERCHSRCRTRSAPCASSRGGQLTRRNATRLRFA